MFGGRCGSSPIDARRSFAYGSVDVIEHTLLRTTIVWHITAIGKVITPQGFERRIEHLCIDGKEVEAGRVESQLEAMWLTALWVLQRCKKAIYFSISP